MTWGEGPATVIAPPIISNIEMAWENDYYRRVFERMGKHIRVITFDKRGIGMSDPFDEPPNNEHRIMDFLAVMDAEGLERAHVSGLSEGGAMAQLFAVAHRERVDRLVVSNTWSPSDCRDRLRELADGPLPTYAEFLSRWNDVIEHWGQPDSPVVPWIMPSCRDDDSYRAWHARLERQTATQAGFRRQFESLVALDTRGIPRRLDIPTLITHTIGDQVLDVAHGRVLAELIAGSKYIEFEGNDHFYWISPNWREIVDSHLEFLTGSPTVSDVQRTFAAVLFTDLVDSTAVAGKVGDRRWAELLDQHDHIAARVVTEHGGKLVKSTGDGVLATFSGPSPAVRAAVAIRSGLSDLGLRVRAGIHAGEVEDRDGDISGFAVNLAARVEGAAPDGDVYVTSTVRDLLMGGSFDFEDAGSHDLKGIDGSWRLCRLV
jgi:class 3 adenylate cyclase/pimeloyl-ACP methyl ester carboxylesterase